MKALIQNEIVVQIENESFEVSAPLVWIDCDENVQVGWTYDGATFSAPLGPTIEQVRERRNVLLALSDWTQVNDAPLNDTQKADWATYRQNLRDVPNSYPNIVWPTKPA